MNRIQKTAYFLVIIVFGTVVLREGDFLLVPLMWGVFFSFALYPIVHWFEYRRIPRGIAIIFSILLVSLLAFAIIYLLLNQMVGLIQEIPEIGQNLQLKLNQYSGEISLLLGESQLSPKLSSDVWSVFSPQNFQETLFNTGKSLTLAGIIPLYIFLLIYYKDFFKEFLARLSKKDEEEMISWVENSGNVIQSYLAGMLRVTGIVAVLAGLFFWIIGVKYFLLFAVFLAVMNLIPYVGVVISSFFVILYVFLTTEGLFLPILTLFTLWGIQLLENNIITPLVVGSKVKVNALAVIFAILIGGWLWGISGMVLFIPLIGVIKITLNRTKGLEPFAYLLGDEVPVNDEKENLWSSFVKRFERGKKSK